MVLLLLAITASTKRSLCSCGAEDLAATAPAPAGAVGTGAVVPPPLVLARVAAALGTPAGAAGRGAVVALSFAALAAAARRASSMSSPLRVFDFLLPSDSVRCRLRPIAGSAPFPDGAGDPGAGITVLSTGVDVTNWSTVLVAAAAAIALILSCCC